MKSYEDITERVFRKGDIILEKRRRRTETIKRTSLALSGICAVILVGFGIWKNNDIKNAINNYYNDCPIITENDDSPSSQTNTEIPVQTSVTEKNTLSTTNTGSDITENHTTFSQTTTVNASTANNTVQTTTIITQHSSLNKTETQAEPLQETIQTTISSTMQTDLIVTNITTTSQNIDDERSIYYMKKLTSFISAITIASSAIPTISNAENAEFKINPSRYWPGESKIFDKMESGELDVDINGNGEFDIMDCYLLDKYRSEYYSYEDEIDPEIIQRIESIADYDGNGTVDFDDTLSLMRYFIVSGNMKFDYLNPAFYDPDIAPVTNEMVENFVDYKEIQAYCFPMRMFYHINYLNAEYYMIDDICESGRASLDFNGNGQLDVGDIYDLYVYNNIKHPYYNDCPDPETARTFITEEEYQRCDDFFLCYSQYLGPYHIPSLDIRLQITTYILNHMEIKPEYFTREYYVQNIENYVSSYAIPAGMRRAAESLGIEVSYDIGPSHDIHDSRHFIDMEKFTPFFEQYCKDVENGTVPAPDVNMDGVVDYKDYFDVNIYWDSKLEDTNESILPDEVWNNINENYDLNGNGIIAELYDLTAIQMYVIKYADEIEDVDAAYFEYLDSLVENTQDIPLTTSYEEDVKVFLSLEVERSGNANNDDDVNIADSVLVMQSIANPDNYKLTTKGKFNADVYNTGDGITCSDALEIQLLSTTK